ncbi:bifunctional phosphopantothenoylcysteine decarboxylase/phosphopantothenate--cysteine ligase CoaBC [Corynebacterium callunae]|uniref:bifunctional phosphopantothenoylcysteine decarboxylase/phosphopantothenate--cysteine ligase CoaBC n=1 Tax=Corynebacterium callunae TaxID=1721 RepID=UPI001FFFBADB|nr:bifunctional phosphopantothenoylcysteine decarboxylase/phosphopantothenate--cysteine ligase CoaBC [Corynebacterium callunae]MCK2200269.1 bifunctional phosphopantothenoylcysteine decarboxylase/phosphopantothenate--cysteine ligase CoaBC [Corynebacterium callunae]
MSSQTTPARKIVVGVAGGIAAYKACQIIRAFKEVGDDVRVVPTAAALNFVGKATFEALSGNPVSTTVFDQVDRVQHVKIGQEADLIVIAPATADLMARLAAGRADDLLAATILVATCPVVIAPAMHTEMWFNPATVANVNTLRERGITVIEPAHGRLTGKDTGPGRLPDPEQIVDIANAIASGVTLPRDLEGKQVLITAGGTQEHIDPVRFIGNSSSGKQGFALAEIAAQRGAKVTIVAGNTVELSTPAGAEVIKVTSTRDMFEAVQARATDADFIVMAAAVADFRPDTQASSKLKKGSDEDALSVIHLLENPDILATTVQRRTAGELSKTLVIVGFAAETGDEKTSALEYAQAKLHKKGCDLLMCNEVGVGKVFGHDDNQGWILDAHGGVEEVKQGSKLEVAAAIWDRATAFQQ